PLEVTPHYVGKVGVLGELWLVWSKGNNSFAGLSRRMAKDFCDRLDKVRPTFDRTARGLGFSLPGKNEVKAMFDSLARKIQLLPHDHECSEYHAQAATIFGGALTFIGRMRACTSDVGGSDSNKKHDKFRAGFPVIDGVRITFCENSLRNIRQSNSCISLFGAAEREALRANFPDFQWNFAKQDNGFWALGLIGSDGELVLPKSEQRQLLVLRLNFSLASYGGGPFRLKIHYGDKEFVYPVYQDEAILFRGIVDGRRNRVIVATESLASQPAVPVAGAGAGVKIYYAGAFSLPEFT
ncbi:MAG: hypothetical protein Q8J76_02650, partial [Desulfobulbaceae bacterium]|nr:hypothetical protein [Desulfobulbaceae bacterium]